MEQSRKNTNETIIENEYYDIFANQVPMEGVFMTETIEKNISFQTQSNAIQNEEEKMKINLQKLHVQKEKWKRHDRNALCWSFKMIITLLMETNFR